MKRDRLEKLAADERFKEKAVISANIKEIGRLTKRYYYDSRMLSEGSYVFFADKRCPPRSA